MMLTRTPRTSTWAGRGANTETSAIAREPMIEVPRKRKLKRTERRGLRLADDMPRKVRHRTVAGKPPAWCRRRAAGSWVAVRAAVVHGKGGQRPPTSGQRSRGRLVACL